MAKIIVFPKDNYQVCNAIIDYMISIWDGKEDPHELIKDIPDEIIEEIILDIQKNNVSSK